jgi:hypothetical protein
MSKENLSPSHELKTRRKPSQLYRINIASNRHMWIVETLETTMDVINRERCFLRKAIKSWNFLWAHFLTTWMEKQGLGRWGQEVCL